LRGGATMKLRWMLVLLLWLVAGRSITGQEKDYTNVPLAELGVELVEPAKDPRTGFVVGGKNTTDVIRGLKELNKRSIADLERDMRPGKLSTKGFLGAEESLVDLLAADNDLVLGRLGLTHQALARPMLVVGAIARKNLPPKGDETYSFRYQGKRFRVSLLTFRGIVHSPFEDDTKTNNEVTVENLDNGKKLKYSLLVPQMIERYGFYEGKGTPYRVEPSDIVTVFDFVKGQK
jgi:hypothetical protein